MRGPDFFIVGAPKCATTAMHEYLRKHPSIFTTTKNAARMPQINERNRLPWSALRCHRDRLSTIILAPFLAVEFLCLIRRSFIFTEATYHGSPRS